MNGNRRLEFWPDPCLLAGKFSVMKVRILFAVYLFLFSGFTFAGNDVASRNPKTEGARKQVRSELAKQANEVFTIDENQLQEKFGQLHALESFVSENPGVTVPDIESTRPELVKGVTVKTSDTLETNDDDILMNIAYFLAGALLSCLGVCLVWILVGGDDKNAVLISAIGCAVGGLVWAAIEAWMGLFGVL